MTSTQISSLCNNVQKTLFWADAEPAVQKLAASQYRFKLLDANELKSSIEKIKRFDTNKLWDKSFMGIAKHESICAASSELYGFIIKIKNQ